MTDWSHTHVNTTQYLQWVGIFASVWTCVIVWDATRYTATRMDQVEAAMQRNREVQNINQNVNVESTFDALIRSNMQRSPYLREKWGVDNE